MHLPSTPVLPITTNGAGKPAICNARLPANPSLQPTCHGWLRQPAQAGELKR